MAIVKWRMMANNKRSRPRRPLPLAQPVRFNDEEEDGGAHQAWFIRDSFQKYIHDSCREHGQ